MDSHNAHEVSKLQKFIDPVSHLSAFLSHGIRPDGRICSNARSLTLNFGSVSTANGSAMVKLGHTQVLAAVKLELSNPSLESSTKGYVVCNIDLTPSSCPDVLPGPPLSEAQSMSQDLQDIISRFVICEDLVIVESRLCWTVYVDVLCLCNSGNIWDASVLATTAALLNTQVPSVNGDGDFPVVKMSTQTRLKLKSVPLSATFAVLRNDYCLLDPTRDEELVCDGLVSIIYFEDGQISKITHKGKSITDTALLSLCKDGQAHVQTFYKLLNTLVAT